MTARPTLTEFLLARIAEDEERARVWEEMSWDPSDCTECRGWAGEGVGDFGPARVLAECGAKRQIVEKAVSATGVTTEYDWPLNYLALPYSDHPDFRDEWRA